MSDNVIHDFFLECLEKNDWLGLSSLYFDNAYVMNVYTTRGYIAYSPSKKVFFAFSPTDSADVSIIEGTYAMLPHDILGHEWNITAVGYEHLQHFDIAQYSKYEFYNDAQEKTPWAHIPTRATIMALEKDPETGLYPETDTVGLITDRKDCEPPCDRIISTIGMYPEEDGYQQKKDPDTWLYSGAIIDGWKRFYKNQEKFRVLLSEAFGVTDAI